MLRRFGSKLDKVTEGERRVWFRLTTRAIDRHGTIIEPAGVDCASHRTNPVFLWMHQSLAEGLTVETDEVRLAWSSTRRRS